jgi:hypothetical protein
MFQDISTAMNNAIEDTGSASKSDQVSAHKEAVSSFQRYANGGDAELKEWAEKSCRNWNTIFKWLRTFINRSHHNEEAVRGRRTCAFRQPFSCNCRRSGGKHPRILSFHLCGRNPLRIVHRFRCTSDTCVCEVPSRST